MKKLISFILCLVTVVSVIPMGTMAQENPFPDVSADAWYAECIIKANEMGLIQGNEKGEMMPRKPITRAEAVEIIRNNCLVIKDFSDVKEIPFTDVKKSDWFYEAVKWAYCYDIVKGVGNNKFKPNDYVTREDFAVMIYRCYRMDLPIETGDYIPIDTYDHEVFYNFNDISAISDYAFKPMEFLCSSYIIICNGGAFGGSTSAPIINGYNGYLKPKATCSRSEAIQIIINIHKREVFNEIYVKNYLKNKWKDIPYWGT